MDTSCPINNDFISYSFAEHIICVFHLEDPIQLRAIQIWQFKAMINNKPLTTIANEDPHN